MRLFASPIGDRKVRFALVGCGRISKSHIDALGKHSDAAELVDVCDVDAEALADAARTTGARPHRLLSDMLAKTDADAVILTTPSGLHAIQAIQVAEAGLDVVSEKPMATRYEDGLAMVKACDAAGVRLFIVKQNRRNATLQLLKRAVSQGRFGRIYMVNINVFWTRPQEYYDAAPWRGTWEYDGGALMNQASHYVDLLDWLVGPIESVHAYTATLERKIQAEDTAAVSLRWRSGALGSMNVTMLTYPRNMEGSITILGEKGSVRIGGVAVNEIQHWEFAEPHEDDATVAEASYATTSVYGFGHPLYYDNVIKTLRGEAEPETDGRSGLRSLETLIAIYRSARDGARVALPLGF
jgi:UDP-N-acetyl-2-amino-2-deoxyglucuronate dehydrogenase